MSDHYFIYTVSGGHEVFYAAVDRATGRVWTAPTKEVAHRQAREAGLTTFTERMISKDALLESLGIYNEQPLRVGPDKQPPADSAPDAAPASPTPWFVAGDGKVDPKARAPKFPFLPGGRGRKRAGNRGRGKSPFAANNPIGSAGAADDILIVPSENTPAAPTPFTDKPAEEPEVEEDQADAHET